MSSLSNESLKTELLWRQAKFRGADPLHSGDRPPATQPCLLISQAGIVVATVAILICAHLLPVGGPTRYRTWEAHAKETSTIQP